MNERESRQTDDRENLTGITKARMVNTNKKGNGPYEKQLTVISLENKRTHLTGFPSINMLITGVKM